MNKKYNEDKKNLIIIIQILLIYLIFFLIEIQMNFK